MMLSRMSLLFCGLILLTLPGIEFGGYFLLQVAVDPHLAQTLSPLQQSFFRAGHAHAGVLTLLGLICQPLADAALLPRLLGLVGRAAVPVAAVLLSAGFFLSVAATPTHPGPALGLVYLGIGVLAAGVGILGVGLIRRWRAIPVPPVP